MSHTHSSHTDSDASQCKTTECEWWEEYSSPLEFVESFPKRSGTGKYWFSNVQYDHDSKDCPDVAGGCVDVLEPTQALTHLDELDWNDNFEWATGYSFEKENDGALVYTGSYRVD